MKTFLINVIQAVEVNIDELEFNKHFNDNFSKEIVQKSMDQHAKDIAVVAAKSNVNFPDKSPLSQYLMGYGNIEKIGVTIKAFNRDVEILTTSESVEKYEYFCNHCSAPITGTEGDYCANCEDADELIENEGEM
jgi:hypothetical protein